ncbi:type II CAAX prenyl endopeptidase Rce1 family protein [Sphingomonas sp. GCM10030256]|uniref:CPBP family glutamic-type intramembrane protease n=1 Tax=Sphingomonas sp. GCM10030256 TaxID=3273427 RepID=UPI00361F604B
MLLTPERPLRYLATAWPVTILPAALLSALVSLLLPGVGQPDFPFGSVPVFLLVVLFAPALETLIMGAVLLVLRRLMPEPWAVVLSSAGWGVAHSTQALAWGLVIWWPFLIFSTAFLAWRRRSLWAACGMVTLMHMLHNLLPALTLLLGA